MAASYSRDVLSSKSRQVTRSAIEASWLGWRKVSGVVERIDPEGILEAREKVLLLLRPGRQVRDLADLFGGWLLFSEIGCCQDDIELPSVRSVLTENAREDVFEFSEAVLVVTRCRPALARMGSPRVLFVEGLALLGPCIMPRGPDARGPLGECPAQPLSPIALEIGVSDERRDGSYGFGWHILGRPVAVSDFKQSERPPNTSYFVDAPPVVDPVVRPPYILECRDRVYDLAYRVREKPGRAGGWCVHRGKPTRPLVQVGERRVGALKRARDGFLEPTASWRRLSHDRGCLAFCSVPPGSLQRAIRIQGASAALSAGAGLLVIHRTGAGRRR